MDKPNIYKATIFGSSSPQEGDQQYQDAYDLAKLLTQMRFSIQTGGYYGTMEAASRGALDAGQTAIGVPMDSFDPKKPNRFCQPEKVRNIYQRLERLIEGRDLITILPGQLGTLTEFLLVWEMLESSQLKPAPEVCLIGENWIELIPSIARIQNIKPKDLKLIKQYGNIASFRSDLDHIIQSIEAKRSSDQA